MTMNPRVYQEAAGRTECDQEKSIARMFGDVRDPLLPIRLNHAFLGIVAEGGELFTQFQKWIYYGKDLDRTNVKEELGDVLWYVAEACNALGISLADVMECNILKLKTRYPEKYTDERAAEENRDRASELRALDSAELGQRFISAKAWPDVKMGDAGKEVVQDGHGFGHVEKCCQYCARPATKVLVWKRGPFGKPGPVRLEYCGSCSIKDALATRGMTAPVTEGEDYTIEEASK
jgi:NTP pyrophosphatase (non-canonical NTP hydrolase)